jgi:hypothetical protein
MLTKIEYSTLCAPDPPGDRTAKSEKIGLNGSEWSRLVQVKSIHLDHKPRVSIHLVQVVQAVQAKSYIMHMRAHARVFIFLHIISILTLEFDFVRKHLDHLDHLNAGASFRLDHPPGPPWTTWTTSMPERVSLFFNFIGGRKRSNTRPKWSDNPVMEASYAG